MPVPVFTRVVEEPDRMAPIVIGLDAELLIAKVVPVKTPVELRISPALIVKSLILKLVAPISSDPPAIVILPPVGSVPLPANVMRP